MKLSTENEVNKNKEGKVVVVVIEEELKPLLEKVKKMPER